MKILNKLKPGDLHMNIVTMEIQKDSIVFPKELELFPYLSCDETTYKNKYVVEARISNIVPFCEKNCKYYHIDTIVADSLISSHCINNIVRTRLEIEAIFNYSFDWEKYRDKNLQKPLDRTTEIAEALYNFIHLVDVGKARFAREISREIE